MVVIIIGGAILFWRDKYSRTEVTICSDCLLDTNWQEIRSPQKFTTTGPWSELWLEVADPSNQSDFTKSIEAYLVTDSGDHINLTVVRPTQYGNRFLLRLSAPSLEWSRRKYSFHDVNLKSAKTIRIKKLIWSSYNPRSTKDGVVIPDALRQ